MVTTVVIDQSDLATCGLIAKIYMLYRGGSAAEWLERRIAGEGPFLTGVILGSTGFNSFMLLANCCLPPTRWDFQLLCSFTIFDLFFISAVPENPLGDWLIKISVCFTCVLSLGFQMLGNPPFLVPSAMRPLKLRITLVSRILLGYHL